MSRPLSSLGSSLPAVVMALVLAVPAVALAQKSQSAGGDSGGGSSDGAKGGGSMSSGGSGGGSAKEPSSGGGSMRDSANGRAAGPSGDSSDAQRTAAEQRRGFSRPRDGRPATGDAVTRTTRPRGNGSINVRPGGSYYGGFYPWGYGSFGLGGYYGYYDPWFDPWYGYGSGGFYGQSYPYGYDYDGQLRLKVKPIDATVYVDGYFAGKVDDFDGMFQRLRVESGPHRIEIRADGYEPLTFEVRILPDRTVTYEGELKRLP